GRPLPGLGRRPPGPGGGLAARLGQAGPAGGAGPRPGRRRPGPWEEACRYRLGRGGAGNTAHTGGGPEPGPVTRARATRARLRSRTRAPQSESRETAGNRTPRIDSTNSRVIRDTHPGLVRPALSQGGTGIVRGKMVPFVPSPFPGVVTTSSLLPPNVGSG